MCVYRTKDGLCKKHSTEEVTSYCVDGPCPDEVLTNGDSIRAMSDEELALFQAKKYAQCIFPEKEKSGIVLNGSAKKALIDHLYRIWLQYLKQPAEED